MYIGCPRLLFVFVFLIVVLKLTIGAVCGKREDGDGAVRCREVQRQEDFGLWQVKMQALLTHQGLDDALDPTKFDEKPNAKQLEILKKARSVIILNLDDKVLREVAREQSAASIWKRIEELYMTKSLANRLYLKQGLYSFKFTDDRVIQYHLQHTRMIRQQRKKKGYHPRSSQWKKRSSSCSRHELVCHQRLGSPA